MEPSTKTVIFDIETVPDYTIWTPEAAPAPTEPITKCEKCEKEITDAEIVIPADAQHGGKTARKCEKMDRGKCRRPKVRLPGEKPFAPLYAHRVLCIGVSVWEGLSPVAFDAIVGADTAHEQGLIESFAGLVGPDTTLVSKGGRHFDLPVLELRALKNGVALPFAAAARVRYREESHIDLGEVFSTSRGSDGYVSLDDLGRCVGLAVKNGVDGSMVETMASAGQWDAIADYCRRDVISTAYLYFRYRVMRGQITREQYSQVAFELRKLHTGQPGMDGLVFNDKLLMLEG